MIDVKSAVVEAMGDTVKTIFWLAFAAGVVVAGVFFSLVLVFAR